MAIEYFTIAESDYEKFGKLVMTWSTGDDYTTKATGTGLVTKPPKVTAAELKLPASGKMTPADFKKACSKAGVQSAAIPPGVTTVVFVKNDPKTIVLKIPDATMIEDMNARVQNATSYPGRDFINDFYNTSAPGLKQHTAKEVRAFTARYLAEYTLKLCG